MSVEREGEGKGEVPCGVGLRPCMCFGACAEITLCFLCFLCFFCFFSFFTPTPSVGKEGGEK